MSLIRQHFLAILICTTLVLCFAIYAVSHRYVHAINGYAFDKWTGEFKRNLR